MSTLNATVLTLSDWAKRIEPDDAGVAQVIELLDQQNEMLSDMLFMEGNLTVGHRTTVRTGLPTVAWRMLNGGVATSKSRTAQIDEQTGMLEAWSEVDKDLAELNGNVNAFRFSEAVAFIEAMNQEMQQTTIYGNSGVAAEEFTGFAPRFSAISGANSGSNVISGGGSGSDNSSIWLVVWGPNTVCGIYPKGSRAGIMHEDLGLCTIESAGGIGTGTRLRAYREHWQWKCGIAMKDWRYVVRIPNIDISNLIAKSSAADLIELMIKATHRVPSLKMGKACFYVNRTTFQMLDIQRRDDVIAGGGLVYKDVDGYPTPTFRNIPVRIVDQLLETEATVS